MFHLQVGLIGRLKAETMNCGGGNEGPHMPTWNHQANMGMGMVGAHAATAAAHGSAAYDTALTGPVNGHTGNAGAVQYAHRKYIGPSLF